MPPKRPPPPKTNNVATTVPSEGVTASKSDKKMQDAMDKFAAELDKNSDDEAAEGQFVTNGSADVLSEVEKELIREELKKTEEEINTLRQVLIARQKHAAELKRKLGISPLTELTADINQSLQHVKESQAYQKTSEVVAETADTVKNKWHDMRNSALFKSFESKLGNAYTSAKIAASNSIDQLSGIAKTNSGAPSQADSASPMAEKSPTP